MRFCIIKASITRKERTTPESAPGQKPHWSDEFETLDSLEQVLMLNWMCVWTYAPVDIGNDSVRDNVLIWHGYGADENGANCGIPYANHPWDFSYVRQLAFVLTADGKQIDEKRTRAIFGAQGRATGTRTTPPFRNDERAFRPLADSIDIFRYGDRYYIDTENVSKENDPAEVIVYLHEHERMRRVCTLRSTKP